jgi:phospholipase C
MKLPAKSLLLVSLATTFTSAQTLPHFQHIVIIVQENRTPDNLFGSGPVGSMCGYPDPFEPGVDIQDGGPAEGKGTICDSQIHLLTGRPQSQLREWVARAMAQRGHGRSVQYRRV